MGVPTPQFSASSDGRVMMYQGNQPVYVDAEAARAAIGATKNRIINGDMRVSQQNGTIAGTASGYYPVDEFVMYYSNGGTQTAQQVASATPGGSTHRLRVTATVADASVGAGDYCFVRHPIEGNRIPDLRLGSASAKTIIIRMGVKAPAGTYCVSLRNAGSTRSCVAEYVIAPGEANTDVVKSVTIALDQTGTWAVDNTLGLEVGWVLMSGTTYQTPANAWVAGSYIASANQYNFMGTVSNVFELFDVSLTVGTTAPDHQVQDYAETLRECQRHFYNGVPPLRGASSGTTLGRMHCRHPVPMRAAPTLTMTALLPIYNIAMVSTIASIGTSWSTTSVLEIDASATANMGSAGLSVGVYQGAGGNLEVNSRL